MTSIAISLGASGAIAVGIDGTKVSLLERDPHIPLLSTASVHLDLGVRFLSTVDSWQLLYADVVCDLVP